MKVIAHHNSQLLVNYPNLESRIRNVSYTVDPEVPREVRRAFNASDDVYSNKDYSKMARNTPLSGLNFGYLQLNSRRNVASRLLKAFMCILIGTLIIIYLVNLLP